jgi:nondiscriminating glutamyl-tRNA synthetase
MAEMKAHTAGTAGAGPQAAIRVRMAPSPTGPLHIGGARTALFNWLFARKYGGTFVLRIEDTDKDRSEKKYEAEIFEGFKWLGLDWDEGPLANGNRLAGMDEKGSYGPYRQSERTTIHKKYLEQLLEKGEAYYCYCTKEDLEAQRDAAASQGLAPKYSGHCRNLKTPPAGKKSEVIRFKVPEVKVEFKDIVRGKVAFDASLFGDIVIAKDLETPLYNFSVVVDDELMAISHVIRGEEHLSNTPRQILMQRALGFKEPLYAHIPLMLNPDRSKMSKRFSDTALAQYREKGYLPEAIINFMALMGWHPRGDRELFSTKELVAEFELERVQRAGAVFNEEKLNWLNREYMKKLSDKEIAKRIKNMDGLSAPPGSAVNEDFLERLVAVERTRANTLRDIIDNGQFFTILPEYEPGLLVWKESSTEEARTPLEAARAELAKLGPQEFMNRETLQAAVTYIIGEGGKRGAVLWPLRVALSGLRASPDPLDIMTVLGKDETLKRIDAAILKLKS